VPVAFLRLIRLRYNKSNINKYINMATKKFNYKQQYGVIVIVENEKEQIKLFNKLKKDGLKLKIVTV
jgi:GTP cyclohydrolase II